MPMNYIPREEFIEDEEKTMISDDRWQKDLAWISWVMKICAKVATDRFLQQTDSRDDYLLSSGLLA